MQVIQFDSHDEMRAYLQQAAAAAHRGLHPEQDRLTFGDYWVRFLDITTYQIEFGRIATPQEVADQCIDNGGTAVEAASMVDAAERTLLVGYMTGWAFSYMDREGAWGTTHKAHVWPIEERLFNAAAEAHWQVELFPPSAKVLLEIAFRAQRAHNRGTGQ